MAWDTAESLKELYDLLRKDPAQFLRLVNKQIALDPADSDNYFTRHNGWLTLDKPELALADLNTALQLRENHVTYEARGDLYKSLGMLHAAIADYDRAESMAPEDWPEAFGPLCRADCHARLGNEAAALADAALLPDDHWTPGIDGCPAGNKQQVIAELKRRAAAARKG